MSWRQGALGRALRLCAAAAGIALALGFTSAMAYARAGHASAVSFSAHGSAEQVYVTGLGAERADVARCTPSGPDARTRRAPTRSVGCCSATCRRAPATACALTPTGAESGPITVHSDAAAPWDPSIYNQSIPDNGYTYLTTRDGTKLAIDVHPPTSPAGEPGAAVRALRPSRAAPTTPRRTRR